MENLKITSLADLQNYSNGQIVELPPFAEGQPFVARLGRPSLLKLAKEGSIPNSLLEQANKLFVGAVGTTTNTINKKMLIETYDILTIMAKQVLLEPTYEDITKAGLELSDDQLMFLFSYSQRGVDSLKNFRNDKQN